ncbi:hypothetical protein SAMN05421736_12361 [Evansella caseinilytica]|uniref:Uncharacterized protein n=1 Tax=Evansella caseinilytica TaxID=1503961 RepID=A0A1H3UNC7_9BACI|nr:hypothetical protein [Evansella caseinilytica]SDZ63551.1 hypothetical protein SAMN05421736_12361 [Evansella caseinilytica]
MKKLLLGFTLAAALTVVATGLFAQGDAVAGADASFRVCSVPVNAQY